MPKRYKKSVWEFDVSIGGVSLTQKALFAKHLALMLKAGLPISEALLIARDSAKGKLRDVLLQVSESVESGRSLSTSFKDHPKVFSGLFINVTQAGESSGTLVENLDSIAEQLKKEHELILKIKAAMTYPILVLIASFILGMALSFLVLPQITPLFEGLKSDLPITTRALIAFSNFVKDNSAPLFFSIVSAVIFFVWVIRQNFSKPAIHWILLHTPIVGGIVRATNLNRFSRTLGMLLKSGINIDEAMNITTNTMSNHYYERALRQIGANVIRGTKLYKNLEQFKGLFPTLFSTMVRVGEESGNFEETLFYLSDFYDILTNTNYIKSNFWMPS